MADNQNSGTVHSEPRRRNASTRLTVMLAAGVLAGLVTGVGWSWVYAPTVGWAVAALVYSTWVWIAISGLDSEQTAKLASREDTTRGVSDLLIVLLSLASLFSLGVVLVRASAAQGALEGVLAGLAVVSVALSWILLHTLFTLHYARVYYTDGGSGVDFNQTEAPRYSDFAYLAFTIGMTFQVSDTNLTSRRERVIALRHALLSFVFGSVILATTVNLIAGLSSRN